MKLNTYRSSMCLWFALIVSGFGCEKPTAEIERPAVSTAELDTRAPTPEEAGAEVLAEYDGQCDGDALFGRVSASENTLGVTSYAYAVVRDEARVDVVMESDEGELARWSLQQLRDETGQLEPGSTQFVFEVEGEATPITMRTSMRALGPDRVVSESMIFRGEESFGTMFEFDEFGKMTAAKLSMKLPTSRAQEIELGEQLAVLGDQAVVSLDLLDAQGALIDGSTISAWLEQAGVPEWYSGREMELLALMSQDASWLDTISAHVRGCDRAASIAAGTQTRSQALGANETCTWADFFSPTGGGGTSVIITAVTIIGGAIITGSTAVTVGTAAALVALAVGIVAAGYWYTKKRCTAVGCSSACASSGSNFSSGTCTGRFACKCDDEPLSGAGGDPHIISLDRVFYDLQATGEFVAVEATAGEPFSLHIRQQAREGSICPSVTFVTALATEVRGVRVGAYPRAGQGSMMRVDGKVVELTPGQTLALERGGTLEQRSSGVYTITWPGGERVEIRDKGDYLDVWMNLPDARIGQVRGLWGSYDLDRSNDLMVRGGANLDMSRTFPVNELYEIFAASWQVEKDESLFDYDQTGNAWGDFQEMTYPRSANLLRGLDASAVASARQTCADAQIDELLLDACTLDIVCGLGDSAIDFFQTAPSDLVPLALSERVYFDGWSQQGPLANGQWEVSDDGLSVLQGSNNDPTYFVSDVEYIDVTLKGELTVETGTDDDYIGFVFGYQRPVAQNGDGPDDHDYYILSWKQRNQGPSLEGFTLARVSGLVEDYYDIFWSQTQSPTYQIIDTYLLDTVGWVDNTTHIFELTYARDKVEILIDGTLIFAMTPEDAGVDAFEPGRFGFYNYSQPNVRYANFEETTVRFDTLFSDSFEQEELGLNYTAFEKWDVTAGTVDMIQTSEGYGVDLDGSTQMAGELTTKAAFMLEPGVYEVETWLYSSGGQAETVEISFAGATERVELMQPRQLVRSVLEVRIEQSTSSKLSISTNSADNDGAFLDKVTLRRRADP